jgi:hypothetical protein
MAISQYGNEYYGLSGDVKPLGTPLNGRKFTEMDTSKEYRFDAENQQWLQQYGGGGGGSSTLSGLTDVDISNPTDGQTLVYNATSGKWENGAGGGMPVIDGTQLEEEITLDITAGNLYTLMQNGPVVYKVLGSESGIQFMSYTRIVIAQTDGVHYSFQDETRLKAEGLTSSATVVFSNPK